MRILYRKNRYDEECCYINTFSTIPHLEGPTFSTSSFDKYDDIETFISREEYENLRDIINDCHAINEPTTDSPELQYLLAKTKKIFDDIFERPEYFEFENKIIKEEAMIVSRQFNIPADEIVTDIFEETEYFDRNLISNVYQDVEDLAEHYLDNNFGGHNDIEFVKSCIDMGALGSKIIDYDSYGTYRVMSNDKIVELSV